MARLDLPAHYTECLQSLFARFPQVQSVKVFGSRASGHARRASDLDLAVSAPGAGPRAWSDIMAAIEDAPIIFEIDVVRVDEPIGPALAAAIDRDGIAIYPA